MNGSVLNPAAPVFLPNPVNRSHPLNRGRVAWWLTLPGLTGGRQFYDLMGLYPAALTNLTLSALGWQAPFRPGGYGGLRLSAQSDAYCNAGDPPGLQITGPITVGCWYKLSTRPADGTAYQLIAKDKNTGGRAFTLDVQYTSATGSNSYGVRFYINGGNGGLPPIANLAAEQRAPVAGDVRMAVGTYDGTTLKLYINGVHAGVDSSTADSSIPAATADVLLGRREYTGFTNALDGNLDDCFVYNRALSPAEVRALYDLSLRGYPGVLNRAVRRFYSIAPAPPPTTTALDMVYVGRRRDRVRARSGIVYVGR